MTIDVFGLSHEFEVFHIEELSCFWGAGDEEVNLGFVTDDVLAVYDYVQFEGTGTFQISVDAFKLGGFAFGGIIFVSSFVTLFEGCFSQDALASADGCRKPNQDSTFVGGFIFFN